MVLIHDPFDPPMFHGTHFPTTLTPRFSAHSAVAYRLVSCKNSRAQQNMCWMFLSQETFGWLWFWWFGFWIKQKKYKQVAKSEPKLPKLWALNRKMFCAIHHGQSLPGPKRSALIMAMPNCTTCASGKCFCRFVEPGSVLLGNGVFLWLMLFASYFHGFWNEG